jgi:signal transduction histidine kinase
MATVSFLPMFVTAVYATKISVEKQRASSEVILYRDAQSAATLVGTWVYDQGVAVSGWMHPWQLDQRAPEVQTGLLRSVLAAVPASRVVVLVDRAGKLVADPVFLDAPAPPDSPFAGGATARDADAEVLLKVLPYGEAYRTALTTFGAPYVPNGRELPVFPVAAPSPWGDGLVLGTELGLSPIVQALTAQSTPDHALLLYDGTGALVVGGGHPLTPGPDILPLLMADGTFTVSNDGGSPIAGAVALVPYTDWAVVVVEPTSLVFATAREITLRTVEVVMASLVVSLLVGALVGWGLSQPVAKMRDATRRIADGDYQPVPRLAWIGEIDELAVAFNDMAARLQQNNAEIVSQRQQIEAFNADLQRRVDERTAELQAAQAQLVESGQLAAVAQLGAGLAHELNNPLAGILGMTQILLADPDLRRYHGPLGRVEQLTLRCTEVVRAMLRFSSGDPLDPSDAVILDLRVLLRDVVGLVQGPMRQAGISVELRLPDAPASVRVDPVLAGRAFAPILSSVAATMPAGSSLRVEIERRSGVVEVVLVPSVSQTISDDFMASALGLWVARRLLGQMGGRIGEPAVAGGPWRVTLPEARS